MTEGCNWLPRLIRLEDSGGHWAQYVDQVFSVFHRDVIASQPKFKGLWVRCRRDPIVDGKEAGFWHCISEGKDEAKRTPDPRRCERIAWVRAVIEHADDPLVQQWSTSRGPSDRRRLLWLNECYLVVLGERVRKRDGFKYWQMLTAYCTDYDHTRQRLVKQRDGAV